jgi:V8-like Glu-specific endopeptidase
MKNIIFIMLFITSCSPKSTFEKSILNGRIINGKNVLNNDPIISSVVGIYNSKINYICTGTLIAPNFVVTAAHCISKNPQDLKIVFSSDIDETINIREQDVLHELILPSVEFKIHPTWNPKNETQEIDTGDIALIKFKGNIPAGYRPATYLQDSNLLKIGQQVTIAGFGVNSVNLDEIDPKKYSKLDQAIENGDVICSGRNKGNYGNCFELNRDGDGVLRFASAPISFIHETEIRLNEKNAGTCNGDSGGPAFIQLNGSYFFFGVTSRGSEMCNDVGVYTNALHYKAWIDETIKSMTAIK